MVFNPSNIPIMAGIIIIIILQIRKLMLKEVKELVQGQSKDLNRRMLNS